MKITTLFVLQVINIGIAVIFLLLFLYRLYYLRHFSQTDKYLNYYPKIRILFVMLYMALSFSLLSYNIATKEYSGDGFEYLFAGGGGETINSLILVLLLIVLRQELKKQRPYTPTHMIYFFYLVVISIVRFGLTLSGLITQKQNQQIVDLILACCLMMDSCVQLGYWIAKKQSLPQFESNNYFSFEDFRRFQFNRNEILKRDDLSSRMEHKSIEDDFPYIKPTVNVENSRFRIILEVLASNRVLPPGLDSTQIQKMFLHPSQIQNKNISQLLKSSISFRKSARISQGISNKDSFHLQIISEHFYNLQQIKQLYILCGRFPLKKQIKFGVLNLRQIGIELQQYLQQLFDNKHYYQPFLLKFFLIDRQLVKIYEEKTKGLDDIIACDGRTLSSSSNKNFPLPSSTGKYNQHFGRKSSEQFERVENGHNHSREYEKKRSIKDLENKYVSRFDHNSIYVSVQIYKQLWIEDHYQFYMKIHVKQSNLVVYPMRRFSQFEELDLQLKSILMEMPNTEGHQLPPLPKKHLFNLDEEKINVRRIQLETYLRKLANDYTLVEIPSIRQVQVVKGNVSKALINNDYVTFYQFKLYRQGIEIRSINKRFSDFLVLNQDINRWMTNIQIYYKTINFPEKHLFKSQIHRHEKLRTYLQSIISIKESYQIYALNMFLNISGNSQLSDDTMFSAISFIQSKRKNSTINDPNQGNHQYTPNQLNTMRPFQLEMEKSPPQFSYSFDTKRMSALIDELGKDDA